MVESITLYYFSIDFLGNRSIDQVRLLRAKEEHTQIQMNLENFRSGKRYEFQ